jgi:MFS family permease
VQAVAQGYLVYEFTHSPFWLGLDGFVALSPALVLTLAGGVFADLVDRRRLLLWTQAVAGVAALFLAVLIHTQVIHQADNIWASNVWLILVFSFVTGC